ncbi:MAG: efflux RND transporter periplasmic adaptor subunit [Pseudomonadota bacterium]
MVRRPVAIWKQLILSLAVAAGAAGLWHEQESLRATLGLSAAVGQAAAPAPAPPGVPVIVEAVRVARDAIVFEAVGTGRAERSITLRAEDSGIVTASVLGAETRFAAGDILLELEDRDERIALSLAETRFADATRTLERFATLQGRGATSLATLDEAETAAAVARLTVEQAREALRNRHITAPFDGVSGLPMVEVGDWVESGDAVASFDDRRRLLVELDLPETLLARIGRGDPVEASTPAYPGRSFEGAVVAIDSRVDPENRTARLRVGIPNAADLLRPGASFRLRITVAGEEFPTVPELALQFSNGGLRVWTVQDGRARTVPVTMIRRRAGLVLVDGPLSPGDLVVVEGTQRLREDRAVRLVGDPLEGS